VPTLNLLTLNGDKIDGSHLPAIYFSKEVADILYNYFIAIIHLIFGKKKSHENTYYNWKKNQ
jgi:hypothetical protein